ncbi:hypothetical protein ACFL0V_00090 [Nanoarchaeota archaeon]
MNIPDEKDLRKRKKEKSNLDKETDELYDYNEDSDIPVTEKRIKEKKIKKIK